MVSSDDSNFPHPTRATNRTIPVMLSRDDCHGNEIVCGLVNKRKEFTLKGISNKLLSMAYQSSDRISGKVPLAQNAKNIDMESFEHDHF